MKRILFFILIAAAVVSGLYWVFQRQRIINPSNQLLQPATNRQAVETNQAPPSATNGLPSWTRPAGISDSGWAYALRMRAMFLNANHPLDFHARVMDQNNTPVVGAKVEFRIVRVDEKTVTSQEFLRLREGSEQTTETKVFTTDNEGWVHFTGVTGKYLTVLNLTKEGYISNYPNPACVGISYDYNGERLPVGDILATNGWNPNTGYYFHLWKQGMPEKLVRMDIGIALPESHQAWFNIFNQEVTDPTKEWVDFMITEMMLHPNDPDKQYDRTVNIQGLHGAKLQETLDAYPYLAPDKDYLPEYRFDVLPSTGRGPGGTWDWSKNFYVVARNGKVHAGIKVSFVGGKLYFAFNGYLNPSGSRNLEPDATKLITDPSEMRRLDEATRVK